MCAAPRAARQRPTLSSATNAGAAGAEAPVSLTPRVRFGAWWPIHPVGAGAEAKIAFKVHPHMLRHACGYAPANKGIDIRTLQAYLGHRSINSTTRYAVLAPGRLHLGEGVVKQGLNDAARNHDSRQRQLNLHKGVDLCTGASRCWSC